MMTVAHSVADPTPTSKTRKPGAPSGNTNRYRHGRYAGNPIVLGKPPRGMARPVTDARKLMAAILDAVCERRGETTLYDFTLARDAAEYEVTRRALWRLWQAGGDKLTVEQVIMLRRQTQQAASDQSKCLKALGLDVRASDLSSPHALYRRLAHDKARQATAEANGKLSDHPESGDAPARDIEAQAQSASTRTDSPDADPRPAAETEIHFTQTSQGQR